jgi:hypothetical protein
MERTHSHLVLMRVLMGQHQGIVGHAVDEPSSKRPPSVVSSLKTSEIVDLCSQTAEDCRAFCVITHHLHESIHDPAHKYHEASTCCSLASSIHAIPVSEIGAKRSLVI